MEESQSLELQNAVLERCQPHGAVVHVFVDKKSPYVSTMLYVQLMCSCVYSTCNHMSARLYVQLIQVHVHVGMFMYIQYT